MRILHTEWSDGWGGQERRIVSEMAGLVARGHHLVLATRPQCKIAAKATALGIPVLLLPMRNKLDVGTIVALARYLRHESIDVVSTHSGIDSWIGGLAAKLARTPVLVRTRHLNIPLKRNWLNFVHYLDDQIISCGEAMKTQLVEKCGFPASQITSIPTGIDFARFTPAHSRPQVRQMLGLAGEDFVVLMVGIIRSVKRHAIALEAFQQVLRQHPAAHLIVAGDGPKRQQTEELAHALEITDRVHFLGHRDDIPDLMAASDVLLLTSRSEGVPQAVTQALGLGVPVIATAVGGVPELIQHEQTGLLIPPEDPAAAAEALLSMACNPERAALLGRTGREHALENFNLTVMLDRTEALLSRLLAEKAVKAN
jgi:glycosyltransferase involved in cell wall biosynthesis